MSGVGGSIGLASVLVASVSYLIGGSGRASRLFDDGPGPGLGAIEMITLILGLSVGFALGIAAWSFVATRMGWLSWEDIASLIGRAN